MKINVIADSRQKKHGGKGMCCLAMADVKHVPKEPNQKTQKNTKTYQQHKCPQRSWQTRTEQLTSLMNSEEHQNQVVSQPWTSFCSRQNWFRNFRFASLNLNSPPHWHKVMSWSGAPRLAASSFGHCLYTSFPTHTSFFLFDKNIVWHGETTRLDV